MTGNQSGTIVVRLLVAVISTGAHMRTYRSFFVPCWLLFGFLIQTGNGQDRQSLDWNYSVLRGSWEKHSFRDKFTVSFVSDRKMFYDRADAEYELTPDALRIHTREFHISYGSRSFRDQLVLSDAQ